MTRRPRGLTPEERELWSRVARSAHALHPDMPRRAADTPGHPHPKKAHPPAVLPPFRIGDAAAPMRSGVARIASIGEELAARPVRMDARAHREMSRGRVAPEARIDLHGMTLTEAQPDLVRFVLSAHARGHRLILVITGKGKRRDDPGPIPARVGALRHQVPHWLSSPPLSAIVLQVATAHLKHGGEGAYYVYLRRNRAAPG
jgi:DNA-nicking Smr family endonuclease